MKIIKPGNFESYIKPKRFVCDRCGCVFEAGWSEYTVASRVAYLRYGIIECKCPSCGALARAYV